MTFILKGDFQDIGSIIRPSVRDISEGVHARRILPSRDHPMVGPFVVMNHIGPKVFEAGQGFDMLPHPHIGLATVTYLMDGEIVHRDSLGEVRTIRPGEVNWMTAGAGVVHSERTPSHSRLTGGDLLGIQTWVALPSRYEDVAAELAHHTAEHIPKLAAEGVEFTLIAGASDGLTSPVKVFSDLAYAEIVLTSGARYQVKADHIERAIYVVAGEVEVVGQREIFHAAELIVLKPGVEIILRAPAFHSARVMLIAGEPFPEPRHVYWNFVSSSAERIEQAKADWCEGRFASIPGEDEPAPLPDAWQGDHPDE